MSEVRTIKWTSTNTRHVKEFLESEDAVLPIARFIPRRSKDMTEMLWLNIADDDWPKYASAAVYDPHTKTYLPVETGNWIVRHRNGRIEVVTTKWPDWPDGEEGHGA